MAKKMELKKDLIASRVLSRQDYLVVQANDLSRAFGNLTLNQHRILDFATSFIKKDSSKEDVYSTTYKDIAKHMGYNLDGRTYQRIAECFDKLSNKKLYFYESKENDNGIAIVPLFDYVFLGNKGTIQFSFSRYVTPYLIDLRKNYYSFHLSELSQVKHKYTLVLIKLMQANSKDKNNSKITIKGTTDEFQSWFLGNKKKRSNGAFKQSVLNKAINELIAIKKNKIDIILENSYLGRKIVGYELTIINRQG
ncbi:replication initiation protein [Apilactobacillus sp. TMW 2.2459]|uniref:replication initiation protein n=1 Tax=Apilactobacillus xinyiensis TaxID=2841032 RepID=UPI00200FA4A0|nr:replication initiation protein [Apilactobacillus xinyiensis]MCL0312917.1 replication initiation protein [Apilactobacillus xinyiensis]